MFEFLQHLETLLKIMELLDLVELQTGLPVAAVVEAIEDQHQMEIIHHIMEDWVVPVPLVEDHMPVLEMENM